MISYPLKKNIFAISVFATFFLASGMYRLVTGPEPSAPTPAGEWVGVGKVRSYYAPVLWGETTGPHRDVAMKFTLNQWDSFMDRYTGWGEITVFGEAKPRRIHVDDVLNHPDGQLTIKMTTTPISLEIFDGRLSRDEITWTGSNGLVDSATLHRGTDADYQRLLKQPH